MDFENLAEKKKVFESNQREAEKLRGIVAEGDDFEQEEGGRESHRDLLDEAEIHDAENRRIVDADHEEALAMNAEKLAQEVADQAAADQAAAEKLAAEIKSGVKAEEAEEPSVQTELSESVGGIEASPVQQEGQAAETEEQKSAKKELEEKYPDVEVSTSENFPGSILVRGKDGKKVYSVREEDGQLVGNVSGLMDDGSIGWTQRLGDDDIKMLEQNGIADILQRAERMKPDSFEGLRTKQKEQELERKNENKLLQEINMFARESRDGRNMLRDGLITHVNEMSPDMQVKVAERLFRDYEKDGIEKIVRTGYEIYKELKGTPFSDRFRELEDERLKSAGYSGFNL